MATAFESVKQKIYSWEKLQQVIAQWRAAGDQIVFTNGCFDLIHYGHLHYLAEAKDLGQRLVVGMNSGDSVNNLKGTTRPINDEQTRTLMMASLAFVDAVAIFDTPTPYDLIQIVQPDVLVKGGDWRPDQIVGADIVLARGGAVKSLPFIEGYSTTNIEQKILRLHGVLNS